MAAILDCPLFRYGSSGRIHRAETDSRFLVALLSPHLNWFLPSDITPSMLSTKKIAKDCAGNVKRRARFAGRRTDIFGVGAAGAEPTVIGRNLGEEAPQPKKKLIGVDLKRLVKHILLPYKAKSRLVCI
ncbi:unnamed protein product [Cylicocyclus nassatus]|uniref:Uncharacterized protein n=1 Tax=Cylicocyclus nassatus TaxID=53992 RepID=A0AA36HE57_CYLNA|nr:unnamed protein product [Cylicocyclus nassatus]